MPKATQCKLKYQFIYVEESYQRLIRPKQSMEDQVKACYVFTKVLFYVEDNSVKAK